MKAIILRELRDTRKSLLIWAVVMFSLLAIGAAEYSIAMSGDLGPIAEALPRIIKIMFGLGVIPVDTPLGYYICQYLWNCLVAFAHAVFLGAALISKEERNRTAEFLFTKPQPRKTVISAKIIAGVINVAIINLITWIGTLAMLVPQVKDANILSEISITMLAMFFVQVLFLSLGLFLSGIFKSYGRTLSVSAALVIVAYVLMVVIEYAGTVDFLNFLTPFRYFPGPSLVENGFNIVYLLLTATIITISCYFTYLLYQKRDLHN